MDECALFISGRDDSMKWRKRYVQWSSGNQWVQAFMWTLLWHVLCHRPLWNMWLLQMATEFSKFPKSQSNWASMGCSCPTSNPCNLLFHFPHPLPDEFHYVLCQFHSDGCLHVCYVFHLQEHYFSAVFLNSVSPTRLSSYMAAVHHNQIWPYLANLF